MPHDVNASEPGRVAPATAAAHARRATSLSVLTACVLVALKGGAFAASGSLAVLASLADSALDLAASLMTAFAVRYAAEPADAEHRYGHGKAEALAALVQALLVVTSAALIAREAIGRLIEPEPVAAAPIALIVMAVSIILTLGLIWAQTRAVAKSGSVAVAGDRAHYAADVAANIAVIVALLVAVLGGPLWVDPVIAFAVAAWLVYGAFEIARDALNQVMDRELEPEQRARIMALALDTPGVEAVHSMRTRAAGPLVHVQFHADLDPELSLEAAHAIMVEAEARILDEFPGADVLIHPDPRGRAPEHGQPHLILDDREDEP